MKMHVWCKLGHERKALSEKCIVSDSYLFTIQFVSIRNQVEYSLSIQREFKRFRNELTLQLTDEYQD